VQDQSLFSIYRTAIVLSVAVHLFFVTSLEAAVFLGKTFIPPVHEPLVTIKAIRHQSSEPVRNHSMVLKKENREYKKGSLEKKMDFGSRQTSQILKQTELKAKPQRAKNLSLQNSMFQSFQNFQTQLDQRIQKFQNDLKTLAAQKQELESSNLLTSEVSDLNKVPTEIRKDLIPEYLQKMRFRIAREWLQQVRALSLESGDATVYYRIAQDGTVSGLSWKSSETDELFLNSCLKAVETAGPFGSLPFQFDVAEKDKYLTIGLTFYLRKQNQKILFSLERFRP